MKKRLIVACGSGVATSQTIASKIANMFEDDGISFPVDAVDYKSIQNELPSTSIYVFPGIPFLTGMGVDSIYSRICELVR